MRSSLALSACGLLLAATLSLIPNRSLLHAETKSAGRRLAFLVGVQKYGHAQLRNLDFAERDIEQLGEVLEQSGFTVVRLATALGVQDASRMPTIKNIREQLDLLLKDVEKDDLVLVGLAGHGIQPLGSDSSYFCPKDANPTITAGKGNNPSFPARPETLLSIDGLLQTLDDSGVGQKLLLMDACRNDPGVRGRRGIDKVRVAALPAETGVLLSCSSGQFAFEHKSWGGGHGAFFHEVIEGLKGQAVDADEGGVTWDSLVKHVRKRVPALVTEQYGQSGGEQRPNLIANLSQDLPVLARMVLPARPVRPAQPPRGAKPTTAGLAEAKAGVAMAEAEVAIAQANQKRTVQLFGQKVATQTELDKANAELELAQIRLSACQEILKLAEMKAGSKNGDPP